MSWDLALLLVAVLVSLIGLALSWCRSLYALQVLRYLQAAVLCVCPLLALVCMVHFGYSFVHRFVHPRPPWQGKALVRRSGGCAARKGRASS